MKHNAPKSTNIIPEEIVSWQKIGLLIIYSCAADKANDNHVNNNIHMGDPEKNLRLILIKIRPNMSKHPVAVIVTPTPVGSERPVRTIQIA